MKADYGSSLDILLIVCCFVPLIACAKVANLPLARGMARRPKLPFGLRSELPAPVSFGSH